MCVIVKVSSSIKFLNRCLQINVVLYIIHVTWCGTNFIMIHTEMDGKWKYGIVLKVAVAAMFIPYYRDNSIVVLYICIFYFSFRSIRNIFKHYSLFIHTHMKETCCRSEAHTYSNGTQKNAQAVEPHLCGHLHFLKYCLDERVTCTHLKHPNRTAFQVCKL